MALVAALLTPHGVQYVLRGGRMIRVAATRMSRWDVPARAVATATLARSVIKPAKIRVRHVDRST